MYKLLQQTYP